MTEDEWQAKHDPFLMLCHLQNNALLDARNSRLFAVACCQRVASFLPNDVHRETIEVSARFVEGLATKQELQRLSEKLRSFYGEPPGAGYLEQPAEMCYLLSHWALRADDVDICLGSRQAVLLVGYVHRIGQVLRSEQWLGSDEWWEHEAESAMSTERLAQASLIRDIFGNPFHSRFPLPSAMLGWNDRTVPRIAEGIYADRAFDRMPILHDALLDAGCNDEALLSHCRNPDGHVRGCWALDAILGKS